MNLDPNTRSRSKWRKRNKKQSRKKNLHEIVTTAAVHTLLAKYQNHNQHEYYHDYSYQQQQQQQHTNIPFETATSIISSFFFHRMLPFVKLILRLILVTTTMLLVSIITYVVFYNLIMPENSISKPVYFDYNYQHCHTDQSISQTLHGKHPPTNTMHTTSNPSLARVCPPTAILHLSSSHTQWEAHASKIAPQPIFSSSSSHGIPHYIHLQLTLPESKVNEQIGVFMIETIIQNSNRTILASSKRPVLLPYQSTFLKEWKQWFRLLFYVFGIMEETQVVTISCFDHFLNGGRGGSEEQEKEEYTMSIVEIRLIVPPSLPLSSSSSSLKEDRSDREQHQCSQEQPFCNHESFENKDTTTTTTTTATAPPQSNTIIHNHIHPNLILSPSPSSSTNPNHVTPTSIQISKAELQIGKEMTPLQLMMKEWFYTCFFCFVIFSMAGQWMLYYSVRFMLFLLHKWVSLSVSQSSSSGGAENETYVYMNGDGLDPKVRMNTGVFDSNTNQRDYNMEDDDDDDDYFVLNEDELGVNEDAKGNAHDEESHHDHTGKTATTHHMERGSSAGDWIPCREEKEQSGSGDNGPNHIDLFSAEEEQGMEQRATTTDTINKPSSEKRKKKPKIGVLSSDKTKLKGTTITDHERKKVDKVMRGELDPFEVFTDLDDPD